MDEGWLIEDDANFADGATSLVRCLLIIVRNLFVNWQISIMADSRPRAPQ